MQIDVEHPAIGREREIHRKRCLEDAGIVHEDVQGADLDLCGADEILERLGAREIPLDPVNRLPEVRDLLDVDRRDNRSLRGEPFGDRAADAVGGAGDERDATLEQAHPATVEQRIVVASCSSFDMASVSMVRARNGCSRCSPVPAYPMRITDVEPIVLRIDGLDATRADGMQDAFLVRVHTDEGIVGIGEADTSPYVARTIVEMPSSHSIARGLREVLVGEDPLQTDRLWRLMFDASDHYGRGGAALHTISAIDIALWDIAGKTAGRPVSELLGGGQTRDVHVYASEVMPETLDEVRRMAEHTVEAGYDALKLGWGPLGQDLAHDVALVGAARETLGPERTLMLDGGRAFTVKRALELLRRVEEHDLYWFEEPLPPDDLDGYRRLSDAAQVRIAAGEADSTLRPFRALVEHGHVDVLQPDLARCGGFTVAREIASLERTTTVEIVPHCFSTGVLIAASLHFVATLDRPTWSEYSIADSPLVNGILSEPFALRDGRLTVPAGPGLGINLDQDAVDRVRLA